MGGRTCLLVTGASGYLGSEFVRRAREAGYDVTGTTFAQPGERLDVRDPDAVARLLDSGRFDAVIHTAYVRDGPLAWPVTVDGAANVARAAADAGARLVHLSTDVVFDGRRDTPYRESDEPSPATEYGRAKAEAERRVAGEHPDALIVRTSLLYGGGRPGPHELAALEGAHEFFTDELRCPTHVADLAAALLELVSIDVRGPLHVAGTDAVSRYEFARLVRAAHGCDPDAIRGVPAPPDRPRNCALDSSRAAAMIETPLRGVRTVLA